MALAQVLLPMGTFAETSGSYVNVEGRWQEFRGCAQPVGEARPAWKILRVLANLLGLEGFDYESSADVLAELRKVAGDASLRRQVLDRSRRQGGAARHDVELPIYGVDAIVRRAPALQRTRAARGGAGQGG